MTIGNNPIFFSFYVLITHVKIHKSKVDSFDQSAASVMPFLMCNFKKSPRGSIYFFFTKCKCTHTMYITSHAILIICIINLKRLSVHHSSHPSSFRGNFSVLCNFKVNTLFGFNFIFSLCDGSKTLLQIGLEDIV